MSRYRFALRPRWILSHLFVLAMVVTMVNLGFWQLSRLQEKKDRNERVAARTELVAAEASTLAAPGAFDDAADLEFRRATATGTYLADQEVLVRSRSLNGAAGSWVITPLEVDDGVAVAVNRGWIPNSGELTAVPDEFAAPDGEVTVTGIVRKTETKGSFGADDPEGEALTELARADVARLDQQVPEDLLPFVLQLQAQDPPPAADAPSPTPVPAPALDEGPHLSYAVQWFTFATMTVIVYALILRKRARDLEREARDASLDEPDPDDELAPDDPRREAGATGPAT